MTDLYDNGYLDAVEDILNDAALMHVISQGKLLEAQREIARHSSRFSDCKDCDGTGENKEPTERDMVMAVLMSAGAQVSGNPCLCKTCGGAGMIKESEA